VDIAGFFFRACKKGVCGVVKKFCCYGQEAVRIGVIPILNRPPTVSEVGLGAILTGMDSYDYDIKRRYQSMIRRVGGSCWRRVRWM